MVTTLLAHSCVHMSLATSARAQTNRKVCPHQRLAAGWLFMLRVSSHGGLRLPGSCAARAVLCLCGHSLTEAAPVLLHTDFVGSVRKEGGLDKQRSAHESASKT